MKKSQFAILIGVVVLCACGIFGYVKYRLDNQEVNNNSSSSTSDNGNHIDGTKADNVSADGDINVIDAVSYNAHIQGQNGNKLSVRLPRINGTTDVLNELNSKILNDNLPVSYTYATCPGDLGEGCLANGMKIDYQYAIKNNVVVLYVFNKKVSDANDYVVDHITNNYFYDIENDKVISLIEAAQKMKLKNNELLKDNVPYYITINGNNVEVSCRFGEIENDCGLSL